MGCRQRLILVLCVRNGKHGSAAASSYADSGKSLQLMFSLLLAISGVFLTVFAWNDRASMRPALPDLGVDIMGVPWIALDLCAECWRARLRQALGLLTDFCTELLPFVYCYS